MSSTGAFKNSMRRFFNDKEKKIIFLLSDGVCAICKSPLQKKWHADHIIPFSKGGKTEISNGQALCPICNIQKSNKMSLNFQLRDWQNECFSKLQKAQEVSNRFFVVAGVGSGKTLLSCAFADYLKRARGFDSIIVVSNTENIKINWQQKLIKEFNIELDVDFNFRYNWRDDFDGISITYQILSNPVNVEFLRRKVNKGTLLIVDEIHHAGDNKSWGDGVRSVGDSCGFVLALSGTPTRSDNNRIPFVRYQGTDDNKYELVADYYYSYAQSVADRYCCPIRFHRKKGIVTTASDIYELNYDSGEESARRALNRALEVQPSGPCYVWNMFEDAVKKLSEINDRRGGNYAGLVVCNTIADATALYERICMVYGQGFAEIVTSEDKQASAKINDFKDSAIPWLISVNMVSEGVDIPRIRAIVYATNVSTSLFFTQVMGRGVRNSKHRPNDVDTCHAFIPDYRAIVDIANDIENQITHVVEEIEKETKAEGEYIEEGREKRGLLRLEDLIIDVNSADAGSIYSGNEIPPEDEAWLAMIALNAGVTHETAMYIYSQTTKHKNRERKAEASLTMSVSERKKAMKKKIHKIVAQITALSNIDYSEAHSMLNREANGNKYIATDAMTLKLLERKLELAVELLNEVKRRIA